MEVIRPPGANDSVSTTSERWKESVREECHAATLIVENPSPSRYDVLTFLKASAQYCMQRKQEFALEEHGWRRIRHVPSSPSKISTLATPFNFAHPPSLLSSALGGAVDAYKAAAWSFTDRYPASLYDRPRNHSLASSSDLMSVANDGADMEHLKDGAAVVVSGIVLTVGMIAVVKRLASALSRRKSPRARNGTQMPSQPLALSIRPKEKADAKALQIELSHLTTELQAKDAQLEIMEEKVAQGEFNEKVLRKALLRERAASLGAHEGFAAIEEAFAVRFECCLADQEDLHNEIRQLRDQLHNQQATSVVENEQLLKTLEVAQGTIKDLVAVKEAFTDQIKGSLAEQVKLENEVCRLHVLHGTSEVENLRLREALDEANRTIMDHEALEKTLRDAAGTGKEAPKLGDAPVEEGHAPTLVVAKLLVSDGEMSVALYGERTMDGTSVEESEDESVTGTDYPDSGASEIETETGADDDDDGVSDFFNNLSEAEGEAYRTLWNMKEGERYNVEDLSALPPSVFNPSSGQRVHTWKSKKRARALRALLEANNQRNSGLSSSGSSPVPVGQGAVKSRSDEETETNDGLSVFDSDNEESFVYDGDSSYEP